MFLFEEFNYNEEEARKIYGHDFRASYNWIDDVLMDENYISQFNTPEERRHFMFSVNEISMPSNIPALPFKVYEIHEYGTVENKRIPLDEAQKEYIKNKLNLLGDAVHIIDENFNNGKAIEITYDISKDEYRWNFVKTNIANNERKHEEAMNAVEIPEPSLESWLFMLDAYYNEKNPRIIFKKFKGKLNQLLEYLVIAYKLNWPKAVYGIDSVLYTCFGDGRFISDNINKSNICKDAAARYAKTYEPNLDIQELIDEHKNIYKADSNIPTKGKPVAELLNSDPYIKRFKFVNPDRYTDDIFNINIDTADGKNVWVVICQCQVQYAGRPYYLSAYEKRVEVQKYGQTYIQFENEINKHTYVTLFKNTLKDLLNDYWKMLMQDIKEYEIK